VNFVGAWIQRVCACGIIRGAQYRRRFMRIGLCNLSASIAHRGFGRKLTDSSILGMGSISGMTKLSSLKARSRSISISMSAIVNGRVVEVPEMMQFVFKAEAEV
jgi:hypothetical protein